MFTQFVLARERQLQSKHSRRRDRSSGPFLLFLKRRKPMLSEIIALTLLGAIGILLPFAKEPKTSTLLLIGIAILAVLIGTSGG